MTKSSRPPQSSAANEETKSSPAGIASRQTAIQGVLCSVVLNAIGQILFKEARVVQPDASLISLFGRPEIWAGIIVYGLSALCWLWVLSRANLSFAYPILSLTFPLVVGLSALLFFESVSPVRWVGVGVIVIGVSLLARTR